MKRDLYEFDALARIPTELEAIHARLLNWAAWSRDRRPQGHCRSIEYRYKPEAGETWEGNEPTTQPETLDALAIYRATLGMDGRHRLILHWYYIKKGPTAKARKRFGLTLDALVIELNRARLMVRNLVR